MTRLVQCNLSLTAGPNVFDTQDIDQELRKLVSPRCERLGPLMPPWFIFQQLRIKHSHHARARTRRGHNILAVFEDLDKSFCQRARFIGKPTVKGLLSATSLLYQKFDFY